MVCARCPAEMKCARTGYGARWGEGHYYPGDLFECPSCGAQAIRCNAAPIHNTAMPGVQMEVPA